MFKLIDRRSIAVAVASIECLIFGLTLGGWPSVIYLIKQDGIFHYLCNDNSFNPKLGLLINSTHELITINQTVCVEEEAMYNLILTISQTLRFLIYLPTAFIIDRIGLKFTRTLACLFTMSGGLMLGFCSKDHPYLLVSGFSLVGISGPIFVLSNFQIANVFPRTKATVLAILAGAQAGAVSVYLLFKFLSDYASVSWNISFIIWGTSASLTLFPTFLLLPKVVVNLNEKMNVTNKLLANNNSGQVDSKNKDLERNSNKRSHKNYKSIYSQEEKLKKKDNFMKSLLSFSFFIHCYSLVMYNINISLYNGSYNWWINQITDNENTVSGLTDMLGIVSMLKVLLAPLGGVLMDYHVNKYKKEEKDVNRAGLTPLLLAAICHTSVVIATLVFNIWAVRISTIFVSFSQATYLVAAFSYTRIRFPKEHFNRLIGVIHLVAVFEPIIQHALFRLLMTKETVVQITLLGFIGISYLNPFHLLCLRKERMSS